MKNHTLSQQDFDFYNGNVSSAYEVLNSHTISQCEYSSTFKEIDGDAENVDVSSGYGSMNRNTDFF